MQSNYFTKNQIVDVLERPTKNSSISSQIIYGEKFKIISKNRSFYKVKTLYDNYIGYISRKVKINYKFKPTHKIKVLKSRIYIGRYNQKKRPLKRWLPFGSKLEIIKKQNNFAMFEKNKWIKSNEISLITIKDKNFIKILKLFINCPYKWGGKTFQGVDCSALIQNYFNYNNEFFPRDTVDQVKIKKGLRYKNIFKKGDIIFWKGHVAVCINSKNLIHAYGPEKKVVIMSIQTTIERIERTANLKVKKIFKI